MNVTDCNHGIVKLCGTDVEYKSLTNKCINTFKKAKVSTNKNKIKQWEREFNLALIQRINKQRDEVDLSLLQSLQG